MKNTVKALTLLMALVLSACANNGDTGTKTASPAELKKANDLAKQESTTSALQEIDSIVFNEIASQTSRTEVVQAELIIKRAEKLNSFSLKLRFESGAVMELSGTVRPITDSDSLSSFILDGFADVSALYNRATDAAAPVCLFATTHATSLVRADHQIDLTRITLCKAGSNLGANPKNPNPQASTASDTQR